MPRVTTYCGDGAPSAATAELLYDQLDFVHGMEAFIGAFPAVSVQAIRDGFLSIGVEDDQVEARRWDADREAWSWSKLSQYAIQLG